MSAPRPLALITGGWRRLGAAIARRLASDGWDLALHAHHAESFDTAFADELRSAGAVVFAVAGDLRDAPCAAGLVGQVGAMAGRVPVLLVNCASIFHDDTIATLSLAALDEHFRTNLFAPLVLTRAFADALGTDALDRDGPRGSVVHILDQRVINPVPDQLSYGLSKQALHASVRTLARALAPRVRVNGVAPGLILPTDDYDEAQWRRLAGIMPLQHLPADRDIADAVAFLSTAQSVTGQTIFVDAGANLEAYPRDFVYLER
ncbi:SDR family oxidoreductase [Novosphingobium lentum]|uniref:SDR family oxidoreductase n=1 Tax=Novosphingobium lentum TaxID=145287 RepID=UPI0008343F28|nr:SDR family NAD(P)-dependent oxidoreductase [Novosphingobium lentum]